MRKAWPLFLLFALLPLTSALAAGNHGKHAVERALQGEIADVMRDRISPKFYVATTKVTGLPAEASGSSNRLPFTPVAIDKDLVDRVHSFSDDVLANLEGMSFEVVLTFDTSLKPATTGPLEDAVRDRLKIDGQARVLTVKRALLFDASADPALKHAAADDTANAERLRAEAASQRAQLETERARLELTRQQIQSERERTKLEAEVRAQEAAMRAQEADQRKRMDELANKADGAKEQRAAAEGRTPLNLLRSLQPALVGILLLMALIISFLLVGSAFKRGLGGLSDGIKTISSAMGDAVKSRERAREDQIRRQSVREAKDKEHHGFGKEAAPSHWKDGVQDYEEFLEMVREKIEVLSRTRNLGFIRRFVDLVEKDESTLTAAAALLALPDEAARVLVGELSAAQIAKLRATIEAPGGLARAKATRGAALQELYGRIALDEFLNSPLSRINDMGWLARLSSAEIVDIAVTMDVSHRAAFLACLSPARVRKVLESCRDERRKAALLEGIAALNRVDQKQLEEFARFAADLPAKRSATAGVLDAAAFVGEFMNDLSPDDQQSLLKAMASDPETAARLREHFVPFGALARVALEWVTPLFADMNDVEISTCLFAAEAPTREQVIKSLPRIRAEVVRSEIAALERQTHLREKHRRDSLALQQGVAKRLLQLVRDGLVTLSDGGAAEPTASRPPVSGFTRSGAA